MNGPVSRLWEAGRRRCRAGRVGPRSVQGGRRRLSVRGNDRGMSRHLGQGFGVGLVLAGIGAICLGQSGCGGTVSKQTPAPVFKGVRVVIAAVGDPAVLPTVTAQRGEWEASREGLCAVL